MRTHREIVQAVGASELYRRLSGSGLMLAATTPQRWSDRNSIPDSYWAALADMELATLEELAAGADARKPNEAAA